MKRTEAGTDRRQSHAERGPGESCARRRQPEWLSLDPPRVVELILES
jgi:hypothetical protein